MDEIEILKRFGQPSNVRDTPKQAQLRATIYGTARAMPQIIGGRQLAVVLTKLEEALDAGLKGAGDLEDSLALQVLKERQPSVGYRG